MPSQTIPARVSDQPAASIPEGVSAKDSAGELGSLVEDNLGLVHMVVRKYARYGRRADELVSDGTLGLIRAARNFDPRRCVRFSTYAVRCIECEVLRGMEKSGSCGVSTPASVRSARRKIEAASRKYFMEHGRPANPAELSAILRLPVFEIDRLRAGRESGTGSDDSSGESWIPASPSDLGSSRAEAMLDAAEDVRHLMSTLSAEEQAAVRAYFGMESDADEWKQGQVGGERSKRVFARAMLKLRNEAAKRSAADASPRAASMVA